MSEAVLVRHAHDLVWVTGPDAVAFLDGQLSQDVAAMAEGSAARSFLLEPRGKVVALLWLLRDAGRVGILCDPGLGEVVASSLDRFKIRVDAEIDRKAAVVAGLWGGGAADLLEVSGVEAPLGWRDRPLVASVPARGLPRFALDVDLAAPLMAAGAAAGKGEAEALRIEAGEPVVPIDVDESVIPQESGLVPEAVSFTKGCFLGQELVARIDSRGRVNRHLRGLVLKGDRVPPQGATIEAGGEAVGTVGSTAFSPALGAAVALGLLRREVQPGDHVVVRWDGGEAQAAVRDLPMRDFTAS